MKYIITDLVARDSSRYTIHNIACIDGCAYLTTSSGHVIACTDINFGWSSNLNMNKNYAWQFLVRVVHVLEEHDELDRAYYDRIDNSYWSLNEHQAFIEHSPVSKGIIQVWTYDISGYIRSQRDIHVRDIVFCDNQLNTCKFSVESIVWHKFKQQFMLCSCVSIVDIQRVIKCMLLLLLNGDLQLSFSIIL